MFLLYSSDDATMFRQTILLPFEQERDPKDTSIQMLHIKQSGQLSHVMDLSKSLQLNIQLTKS